MQHWEQLSAVSHSRPSKSEWQPCCHPAEQAANLQKAFSRKINSGLAALENTHTHTHTHTHIDKGKNELTFLETSKHSLRA